MKMENKYQEALDYIVKNSCDKRVIDKAKELSDSNDELRRQLYFIEPYKFEE